jgi:hypothetical protein
MPINRQLVNVSRTIHIYLSIGLLVILVFFSLTGITLNHVDTFTAAPETNEIFISPLPDLPKDDLGQLTDSRELDAFLRQEFGVDRDLATLTFEGDLVFVDYRAPGTTTFIEIDVALNEAAGQDTDYGFIAMLNDLHKARDTEVLWKWLVDASAVILVLFSLAGLVLLLPNKYRFKRVTVYTAIATVLITAGYWLGTL